MTERGAMVVVVGVSAVANAAVARVVVGIVVGAAVADVHCARACAVLCRVVAVLAAGHPEVHALIAAERWN